MFPPKVWLDDCDLKINLIWVLKFLGSVCALDKATLKAENHAIQCSKAGPYNGITSKLLEVGSVCGLGPDFFRHPVKSIPPTQRISLQLVDTFEFCWFRHDAHKASP